MWSERHLHDYRGPGFFLTVFARPGSGLFLKEAVADAGFVYEEAAGWAQFFAEVADVDAEAFCGIALLAGPYGADDLGLGDDAACVFCEDLQQGVFSGG